MSDKIQDNDTDSEEEILVYAEFADCVNIEKYRSLHILGVNDKNPVIQMDETFYVGKYENPLGTYMFFDDDPNPKSNDPIFEKLPAKNVKYLCQTRKLLSMEHAYVTPKEGKDDLQNKMKVPIDDVQPVAFKDLNEATNMFREYFNLEPLKTDPNAIEENNQ